MDQVFQILQNWLVIVNQLLSPSACIAIAIILLMILFVLRLQRPAEVEAVEKSPAHNAAFFVHQQDIQAIAGEDEIATQLDLARAYIEMEQKSAAAEILTHVAANGNVLQQQLAKKLLAGL